MKPLLAFMRRPAVAAIFSMIVLCVLSYPLFFHHLAERDLWSSHEGRAAQDASVILETGRWGLPRLYNGWAELQKPPLYYWLVAAIGKLRDGVVDGWSVRLPATLAAVGSMLFVLFFGWRRGRPVAGLLAGLFLATMAHFTWMARVGRIDTPLSLAVAVTLGCYYLAYEARRQGGRLVAGWLVLAYVAMAVAVHLKGPVGVMLPAVVIALHQLFEGEFTKGEAAWPRWKRVLRSLPRVVHSLGLWWGLPLVLLLVLPWFLWVNHETHNEFFRVFFLRHNLQRGLGGDEQFEAHFHPWWFYASRLAIDLQPWSMLLPLAVWFLWRRGWWRADPDARFGAVWFVSIVVLLSIFEYKRADYLLPAYPGAALLLGCVADRWLEALASWKRRMAWSAFAAIALALAVGWMIYVDALLPRWETAREHRSFAEEVRRRVPRPGLVILFRVEVHDFVYHLGRSVDRIWEWENLDIWACQPVPVYVVMPESELENWPAQLEAGRLHPIVTNSELVGIPHEQPMVLVCTRPIKQ
jgi:4-amino-4-deoxy-L-arabinose transferase-like glycosyltransferase